MTFLSAHTYLYFWLSTILYVFAFFYAWHRFNHNKIETSILFYILLGLGFTLQIGALYTRTIDTNTFPSSNVFEIIQVIIVCFIFITLLVLPVTNLRVINFFIAGFASLFSLISLCIPSTQNTRIQLALEPNIWLHVHVSLAILSYSVFSLMSMSALMFLIQDYGLNKKLSQGIFKSLPSLLRIEAICAYLLYTGICLLALSSILGFIISWTQDQGVSWLKHGITWSLLLMYIGLLILKETFRINNKTFAKGCLYIFIISFLCLWPLQSHKNKTRPSVSYIYAQ